MPRVWMRAKEVLISANRQAGLAYAVVPPQFETPVGPFSIDEPTDVQELIDKVGECTNTNPHWMDDVIVFDGEVNGVNSPQLGTTGGGLRSSTLDERSPEESGRCRIEQLSQLKHSKTIPELSALAGWQYLWGWGAS